jgi:hypothetical protein
VTAAGAANGQLLLSATTDNQGLGSVQFDDGGVDNAEAFIRGADADLVMIEYRAQLNRIATTDWLIGAGETDATALHTDGTILTIWSNNHIGFHHLVSDAGAVGMSVNGADGTVQRTQLGSGVDHSGNTIAHAILEDDTWYKFGIRMESGQKVEFYINDKLVHVVTITARQADTLAPTLGLIADGSASTMNVDYAAVVCNRA